MESGGVGADDSGSERMTSSTPTPKRFNDPRDNAEVKLIHYVDRLSFRDVKVLQIEIPHRKEDVLERHQIMVNAPSLNRVNVVMMLRRFADDIEKGIEWTKSTND